MSTTVVEPQAVDPDHLPPMSIPGRMGPRAYNRLRALFGLPWQRRLAYAALQVDAVRHWEAELGKLDDAALKKVAAKLRGGAGGAPPFWAAWGAGDGPPAALDPRIQRELNFALVDEADSVFIDEARTPLIISAPTRPAEPEEQVVYLWANELGKRFRWNEDFTWDLQKQKVELTEAGKQKVRYSNPPSGQHSHAMDKLHEHVERAVHSHHRYALDQHYIIHDGKIVIVDEYTGRPMPDRHWREGLHQAVEAKEGVQITLAADHAAKVNFQAYFKLYKKRSGMTGTAIQNFY